MTLSSVSYAEKMNPKKILTETPSGGLMLAGTVLAGAGYTMTETGAPVDNDFGVMLAVWAGAASMVGGLGLVGVGAATGTGYWLFGKDKEKGIRLVFANARIARNNPELALKKANGYNEVIKKLDFPKSIKTDVQKTKYLGAKIEEFMTFAMEKFEREKNVVTKNEAKEILGDFYTDKNFFFLTKGLTDRLFYLESEKEEILKKAKETKVKLDDSNRNPKLEESKNKIFKKANKIKNY